MLEILASCWDFMVMLLYQVRGNAQIQLQLRSRSLGKVLLAKKCCSGPAVRREVCCHNTF